MSKRLEVPGAEAIARIIQNENVDTVFGIASGYLTSLLDAFRRGEFRCITNLHEGAAAFAAAGYALAGDSLGVVYGQAGPGVTNILTGAAAAYADSVPMLVVASQSPSYHYGRDGHQESTGASLGLDQIDTFRSCSVASFRPPSIKEAIGSTRRAISAARTQRSVAVVDYPADFFVNNVEFDDLKPAQYRAPSRPVDLDGIRSLAAMIRASERPAFLLGNRCVHRGLGKTLTAIAERLEIPVAVTDGGKGVFAEDHPLSLGFLAAGGHDSVVDYLRSSDLVIVCGARLTATVTHGYDATLFSKLVQVDEHIEDIGRNFPLELGIVSNLPAFFEVLDDELGPEKVDRGNVAVVATLREKYGVFASEGLKPKTTPSMLAALRKALPREARIVGDSGLTLQYVKRQLPVYSEDGFYCLYGSAAMGSGVPLAIGVQLAKPDDVVVSVVGDGGALVYLSELAVAAQYRLPIIFVVINNGGYRQISDRMDYFYGASTACTLPQVDFPEAARACGCHATRVTDEDSLIDEVEKAVARRAPSLIEVIVEGDDLFDITSEKFVKFWSTVFKKRTSWPWKDD